MGKITYRLLYFILIVFSFNNGFSQAGNSLLTKKLKQIDAIQNDSFALVSLETISKRVTIKEQLEINWRIISRANSLQKFKKAIAIGNESVIVAHKHKLDSLEAVFNKLLGVSYYYIDRKRAAVPYFEKAIVISKQNNFWQLEANCNNNIGGALTDLLEYKLAEPYLLKSISIMKEHGKESDISTLNTYRVLARFYSESGKPEKAEELYLVLIEKSKEIKDTALLSDNLLFYSEILSRRGEVNKAVEMSSMALSLIRKSRNAHALQMGLTIHAYNLNKAGKYKEAYKLVEESKYLMRSIFAKDLEKEISEVEVKYKTAQIKQEKEFSEIKNKKQKQIYLFSFLVILLVLGSVIYVWNLRKNNRQKAARLTELAEIEKLNFKDVLEAEEKERSRIARELHDGLGQMLSTARLNVSGLNTGISDNDITLVNNALKIIDDSCEEVRNIAHNMMPGALIQMGLIPALEDLFENINAAKILQIHFIVDVTDTIGVTKEISIYRIIQEMLNNIIKHAKAKNAYISIVQKQKILHLQIKDDGIGFSPEKIKESAGIGWKNIYSRLTILNGSINIESEEDEGLVVNILIGLESEK